NQPPRPLPLFPAHRRRSIRTNAHRGECRVPACSEASPPLLFQCRPNARQGKEPTTDLQAPRAVAVSRNDTDVYIHPVIPRCLAPFDHLLEHLPVSQSIHGPPETLISVRHQVSGFDQAIERLKNQLFAVLDVIKNFFAKDKIATIDPNIRLLAGTDSLHDTPFIEFRQVKTDWWMNGNEATNLPACLELIDHLRKRRIGQPVAVV